MNVDMRPIHYHKTVSEDGITHNVVLGKQETGYQVHIHETFWECDNEEHAKALLIQELKILRKQLEQELNKRFSFKEVDNEIQDICKFR